MRTDCFNHPPNPRACTHNHLLTQFICATPLPSHIQEHLLHVHQGFHRAPYHTSDLVYLSTILRQFMHHKTLTHEHCHACRDASVVLQSSELVHLSIDSGSFYAAARQLLKGRELLTSLKGSPSPAVADWLRIPYVRQQVRSQNQTHACRLCPQYTWENGCTFSNERLNISNERLKRRVLTRCAYNLVIASCAERPRDVSCITSIAYTHANTHTGLYAGLSVIFPHIIRHPHTYTQNHACLHHCLHNFPCMHTGKK